MHQVTGIVLLATVLKTESLNYISFSAYRLIFPFLIDKTTRQYKGTISAINKYVLMVIVLFRVIDFPFECLRCGEFQIYILYQFIGLLLF